jgi:TolB-like protein/Flp pilus assembly protein TadD/DNA-binding winged helix-turn-helix (wHTH) protein
MDCGDLMAGFWLGDWLVEPCKLQISKGGVCGTLQPAHMRILVCLARRHGEVVDRQTLRECAGADRNVTDDMLRIALHELRDQLGDSTREPHYILAVPHRGYALVAHFEPLASSDATNPRIELGQHAAAVSVIARVQHLAAELQRRHVFKVLGAYMLGIWIVLQVAETTFEPLHLPDWWMTALTILAVIGVPVIASLAWSYEVTPGGITLDPVDAGHLPLPHARRAVAPLLVIGVAFMAGVTGLAWWKSIATREAVSQAAALPKQLAIAVLPFIDLTPNGGGTQVGDGLTVEISARLARIPGLRVVPPAAAFEFKGRSFDPRKVGQTLGVQHVLQGNVRREKGRLKVSTQLFRVANGRRIWAENYERGWQDVTEVQDQISRSVANAVGIAPESIERQQFKRADVGNLLAYDHYLAGVAALRSSGDLSELNLAMDLFHQALKVDPTFVRALAGLCEAGVARYERTLATADVADAETHCRKALELDASLKETEMALAGLYLVSGRYEQAEAVYRGLAARYPRDADAYAGLGQAADGQGRAEDAERNFRRAVEVEPAYPGGYRALGGFLFKSGRPGEAVAAYRKVIELKPQSASAHSNLGAALMMQGEPEEAAHTFAISLQLEPSRTAHANLGTTYYYLGRYQDALSEYEKAQAIASLDHQLMGNLADALWMIPQRHGDASMAYRRAAELAEEALKVNPTDATTWSQLAYYWGRAGDPVRSSRAQVRAEALGQDQMYVHYYTALVEADRDDPVAAIAAIERARLLGYPQKLLEADPVLKALTQVSLDFAASETASRRHPVRGGAPPETH